jgi:uncharacterized protein YjiS (DUF1127 family)
MTLVANDNTRPSSPGLLSRLVSRFIARRRNVRAMRALLEMSDHILRDIGVTRHDIRFAIRAGITESCGARLARVVEERRLAGARRERAATDIRPHTVNEQTKLAA